MNRRILNSNLKKALKLIKQSKCKELESLHLTNSLNTIYLIIQFNDEFLVKENDVVIFKDKSHVKTFNKIDDLMKIKHLYIQDEIDLLDREIGKDISKSNNQIRKEIVESNAISFLNKLLINYSTSFENIKQVMQDEIQNLSIKTCVEQNGKSVINDKLFQIFMQYFKSIGLKLLKIHDKYSAMLVEAEDAFGDSNIKIYFDMIQSEKITEFMHFLHGTEISQYRDLILNSNSEFDDKMRRYFCLRIERSGFLGFSHIYPSRIPNTFSTLYSNNLLKFTHILFKRIKDHHDIKMNQLDSKHLMYKGVSNCYVTDDFNKNSVFINAEKDGFLIGEYFDCTIYKHISSKWNAKTLKCLDKNMPNIIKLDFIMYKNVDSIDWDRFPKTINNMWKRLDNGNIIGAAFDGIDSTRGPGLYDFNSSYSHYDNNIRKHFNFDIADWNLDSSISRGNITAIASYNDEAIKHYEKYLDKCCMNCNSTRSERYFWNSIFEGYKCSTCATNNYYAHQGIDDVD